MTEPEQPIDETTVPEPPPRRGWWKAFALTTVVFTSGVVFGAILTVIVFRNAAPQRFDAPEFRADRAAAWLSDELELTPEQRERIREIFRSQHELLAAIRTETEPRVREVLDQTHDLVMAELTENQRALWETKFEKMRKRMRAPGWDRPGTGSRGPWEPSRVIQRHDQNSDGTLSFDEAVRMWERITPERFGRVDTNGDGAWDVGELTAIRSKSGSEIELDGVELPAPIE